MAGGGKTMDRPAAILSPVYGIRKEVPKRTVGRPKKIDAPGCHVPELVVCLSDGPRLILRPLRSATREVILRAGTTPYAQIHDIFGRSNYPEELVEVDAFDAAQFLIGETPENPLSEDVEQFLANYRATVFHPPSSFGIVSPPEGIMIVSLDYYDPPRKPVRQVKPASKKVTFE